jgi:ABC-2 type transport system permease protein
MQIIAQAIPATYVFEGMRQVLRGEPMSYYQLVMAFALNIVYLLLAGLFFNHMFNQAREKGLLAKLGA